MYYYYDDDDDYYYYAYVFVVFQSFEGLSFVFI